MTLCHVVWLSYLHPSSVAPAPVAWSAGWGAVNLWVVRWLSRPGILHDKVGLCLLPLGSLQSVQSLNSL